MNSKIKIAIYGLGQETEKNIDKLARIYNIVGLLDSFATTGYLYGYQIIDIDTAIEEYDIQKIIVIARPGSCRAIAEKIRKKCTDSNVELVDINNNNLLIKKQIRYDLHGINGYTFNQFYELVNKVDAVSFDLFDTLVTRPVQTRECLFDIIENKHKEYGIEIDSFVQKRLEAEIILSRKAAPCLAEIYKYIIPEIDKETIDRLVQIEFDIELSMLVPRNDVVKLVDEVYRLGKRVFVTTDTFYSEGMIQRILGKCNISSPITIINSCDNNTSKTKSLFSVLINKAKTSSILHIGDDIVADVESAEKAGLCAFHIYSPIDFYNMVGGFGLDEYVQSLSDRIKVGMLISKVFNNAFLFEEDGLIAIDSLKTLGYTLFAPMLYDYTEWIGQQSDGTDGANLIFSARDGFILQKLFSLRRERENSYFLTSRIAAIRAGVECEEDIQEIEKTGYTGSLSERIRTRYGIDILNESYKTDSAEGVLNYASFILESAKDKKNNYLKYINKTVSFSSMEPFFVDMTAKGTIQKFLEKIISRRMRGLYFLQLEPDFAKANNLEIDTFYDINDVTGQSVFDDFYILEPIVSSKDSTLEEFDINGDPVFSPEVRTEDEIRAMDEIQAGILEYALQYLAICPFDEIKINQELDEKVFKLIHKISISAKDFYNIRNIDSFVNRSTHIDVEV